MQIQTEIPAAPTKITDFEEAIRLADQSCDLEIAVLKEMTTEQIKRAEELLDVKAQVRKVAQELRAKAKSVALETKESVVAHPLTVAAGALTLLGAVAFFLRRRNPSQTVRHRKRSRAMKQKTRRSTRTLKASNVDS